MVTVWPINNLGLHQLGALNGKLKWAPEITRDMPEVDSRTQGYRPSGASKLPSLPGLQSLYLSTRYRRPELPDGIPDSLLESS